MATEKKTCEVEVWVLVDADGNYVASASEDALADLYDADVGADASTGRRVVKVTLTVPLPQTVELTGEVTDDEDAPVLTAAK